MTRYVDTNILVRLMTNDIPDLAREAIDTVNKSRPGELIILDAALVELFFVLEANKRYGFAREKIAIIFNGIIAIPQFSISNKAKAAFSIYIGNKKLDFMDCLIAISGNGKKENVLTFDKDLQKILI
jgi:predicted nucleic-acid-binding protein